MSNLTVTPGLKIPQVQQREPNLRCRMRREIDPSLHEDVVVRVKHIESLHGMPVWSARVFVSLLEFDEREAIITFPPALSHRRVYSFLQSVPRPLHARARILPTPGVGTAPPDAPLPHPTRVRQNKRGKQGVFRVSGLARGQITLAHHRVPPADASAAEDRFNRAKAAHR